MSDINPIERKLPFSLEAEQAVLGSVLIAPNSFNEIADIITSDDFYLDEHRELYLTMQELFLQSRDIDLVTVIDMLVRRGIYDATSGKEYLRTLAKIVPTASNVRDYANIVKDKSMLRRLIEVCDEISNIAYSEGENVSDLIDMAENKILSISRGTERSGLVHIKEIIMREFESFTKAAENPDETVGIPSGFSDLDRVIVGMSPGDLVLIGARPGMGKTSFAMNVAVNFAKRSRKKVCVFSLEMSAQQLASRLLASEARIDSTTMRRGTLSDEEWARLADASTNLSMCEIYIDDTSGIGVAGMKAKLRRMKDVGLVVVDYLQLIQSDRRSDNRVQEVADISRNLKLLAKEMQIPLICCAQLSRGPESRQDKRPMLSDLRDSGAIEQDADIVMFIYRGEYYKTSGAEYEDAEIIIAKNRHGPVGNVKIGWFGKYTKFVTIADDSYEQLSGGNEQ